MAGLRIAWFSDQRGRGNTGPSIIIKTLSALYFDYVVSERFHFSKILSKTRIPQHQPPSPLIQPCKASSWGAHFSQGQQVSTPRKPAAIPEVTLSARLQKMQLLVLGSLFHTRIADNNTAETTPSCIIHAGRGRNKALRCSWVTRVSAYASHRCCRVIRWADGCFLRNRTAAGSCSLLSIIPHLDLGKAHEPQVDCSGWFFNVLAQERSVFLHVRRWEGRIFGAEEIPHLSITPPLYLQKWKRRMLIITLSMIRK